MSYEKTPVKKVATKFYLIASPFGIRSLRFPEKKGSIGVSLPGPIQSNALFDETPSFLVATLFSLIDRSKVIPLLRFPGIFDSEVLFLPGPIQKIENFTKTRVF